ncbi:MAG: hypothetical protein WD595_01405 [Waddliaceae bacterium]
MTEESLSLMDEEKVEINNEVSEATLSEESAPAPKRAPTKPSAAVEEIKKEIDSQEDISVKLQLVIHFMEQSLAQEGAPRFKDFWGAREICMALFKEPMAAVVRKSYWDKYRELSTEARRLKQLLDEQSSFAVEQIDTAISAIEQEVESFDQRVNGAPSLNLPEQSTISVKDLSDYELFQKKLNLYNALSSQVTLLRKELISTEMRIKHKNKFFKRLSSVGDTIFPKRKELIKELSDRFAEDITSFYDKFSSYTDRTKSTFGLRSEIKALQALSKIFTLNTHAFNQSRTKLSECWDLLKEKDKQNKKDFAEKREVFKQNESEILEQLEAISGEYQAGTLEIHQAENRITELQGVMRDRELGHDEVVNLRKHIKDFTQVLDAKRDEELQQKLEIEREKEKERLKIYSGLREEIDGLKAVLESSDWKVVEKQNDEIVKKLDDPQLKRSEKKELQRLLRPAQEKICEQRELTLLEGCSGEAEEYQQLTAILKDRKSRRDAIKLQLETLRKKSGSSGLDFTKLMELQELMVSENDRLSI